MEQEAVELLLLKAEAQVVEEVQMEGVQGEVGVPGELEGLQGPKEALEESQLKLLAVLSLVVLSLVFLSLVFPFPAVLSLVSLFLVSLSLAAPASVVPISSAVPALLVMVH